MLVDCTTLGVTAAGAATGATFAASSVAAAQSSGGNAMPQTFPACSNSMPIWKSSRTVLGRCTQITWPFTVRGGSEASVRGISSSTTECFGT